MHHDLWASPTFPAHLQLGYLTIPLQWFNKANWKNIITLRFGQQLKIMG